MIQFEGGLILAGITRHTYRISRRISRVSGHQNRGQKIDLDLYEGHIISVVRLLIKNLAVEWLDDE